MGKIQEFTVEHGDKSRFAPDDETDGAHLRVVRQDGTLLDPWQRQLEESIGSYPAGRKGRESIGRTLARVVEGIDQLGGETRSTIGAVPFETRDGGDLPRRPILHIVPEPIPESKEER